MTYSARPGTVAFKAITYLQSLDEGAKVTSGNIAAAIGEEGSAVMPCLLPALEAGVVVKSTPPGQQRPAFWSLAPKGVVVKPAPVPPPGPQTPLENPARGIDMDAVHRARKPAPPPVRFMCDHGNPFYGLNACGLCHAAETSATKVEPVVPVTDEFPEPHMTDTPPEKASTEAAQVDGKDSSEDHAEERSRADVCAHGVSLDGLCFCERCAGTEADRLIAKFGPDTPPMDASQKLASMSDSELFEFFAHRRLASGPGAMVFAVAEPMIFAMRSDARFQIGDLLLSVDDTRGLIDYLDSICLDSEREGRPA